jgi:lysozyme family protein
MPDTFHLALDFLWHPDRDGHQDDTAPGEAFRTSWGVTQATWDVAADAGIVSGELADATQQQCEAIYRAMWWNVLRCDAFAPGVGLVLFSDATLTGTGHVARLLQRLVVTAEDGVIGPRTISAANRWVPRRLIAALIAADMDYLAGLANAPKYINGWTRREEALRTAALSMTA